MKKKYAMTEGTGTQAMILTIIAGSEEDQQSVKTINAKTQFAEVIGRRIAYRSIGKGSPIILCNRYRGTLDNWDPLFIDSLAKNFRVILFDYSGIGLSTGQVSVGSILSAAKDVEDLMAELGLNEAYIGGWSYGGMVAQILTIQFPKLVNKTVLIGTVLPGKNAHPIEQAFWDLAFHPETDLADEIIAFFEPTSAKSRAAAVLSHERMALRKKDLDIPVPEKHFKTYLDGSKEYAEDAFGSREKILQATKPILVLMGDHDVCFPIANWYELNQQMENIQLIVFPKAGHAPHFGYPELSANYITCFLKES